MNETTIDRVDRALFTLMVPAGMVGVISVRTTGDEAHIATVWFEFPKVPPVEAAIAYWRIGGEMFPVKMVQPAVEH